MHFSIDSGTSYLGSLFVFCGVALVVIAAIALFTLANQVRHDIDDEERDRTSGTPAPHDPQDLV